MTVVLAFLIVAATLAGALGSGQRAAEEPAPVTP